MKGIVLTMIASLCLADSTMENANLLYQQRKFTKASSLYESECTHDVAEACTMLGYMYDKAQGLPKDDHRASMFYKKGCQLGDQRGCVNYGVMWEKQQADLIQDPDAILRLFINACDNEYGMGCYFAALSFEQGKIVRKNLQMAEYYYNKACAFGVSEACINIKGNHQ